MLWGILQVICFLSELLSSLYLLFFVLAQVGIVPGSVSALAAGGSFAPLI